MATSTQPGATGETPGIEAVTIAIVLNVERHSVLDGLASVQGNPDLKPSFTNNLTAYYNFFDFDNNRTLFSNISFSQTQNEVVTNTIIYPANYAPNTLLDNSYFTKFFKKVEDITPEEFRKNIINQNHHG